MYFHSSNFHSLRKLFLNENVESFLHLIKKDGLGAHSFSGLNWGGSFTFEMNDQKYDGQLRDVLGYFSILEAARLTGLIASDENEMEFSFAVDFLNSPGLKSYCLANKLILPQLFCVRAGEKNSLIEEPNNYSISRFYKFIFLVDEFLANQNIRAFLNLQYDLSEMEKLVENILDRSNVIDAFQNDKANAIRGLIELSEYLYVLQELLSELDEHPLLQSVIWHCHAPWISLNSKLKNIIKVAFRNLTFMDYPLEDGLKSHEELITNRDNQIIGMRIRLTILVLGKYGSYLEKNINDKIKQEIS